MKLNRHDYELIILGLSYLQLHLQKQYEDEKNKTKKDKIYHEHIEIRRLSNIISKQYEERIMIMSKTTLAALVNDILNSLGYKMLKIEFNNEEIACIDYTKDGVLIKDMFIAYRFMKLANLRNKVISEVM